MKPSEPPRIDSQGRRLCTATTTAGNPCRGPAILGGAVCRVHGGSAPQVKESAARVQLEQLIGPALTVLREIMLDEGQPGSVRMSAVRTVLDRTTALNSGMNLAQAEAIIDKEIARLETEIHVIDWPERRW